MAGSEVFDVCAMLGLYPSREWLDRHLQLGRELSISARTKRPRSDRGGEFASHR